MNKPELRYNLPRVRDIMTSPVIALTEEHTVFDALSIFNRYNVSVLPVIEEVSAKLIGIVSEEDCLKHMSHRLFYDEASDDSIGLITQQNVKVIDWQMDIFELGEFFQRQGIRHAPVLENGRVVGTVSRADILKALEKLAEEVTEYRHHMNAPLELSMYKNFDEQAEDFNDRHRFDMFT